MYNVTRMFVIVCPKLNARDSCFRVGRHTSLGLVFGKIVMATPYCHFE